MDKLNEQIARIEKIVIRLSKVMTKLETIMRQHNETKTN